MDKTQYVKRRKLKKRKNLLRMFLLFCILLIIVGLLVVQSIGHLATPVAQGSTGKGQGANTPKGITESNEEDVLAQLNKMGQSNPKIAQIVENRDQYPQSLLELLSRNEETADFVLHYPDKKDRTEIIQITEKETKASLPLFLQWDERWGYTKYGDEMMALTGCGPTCLSMVIVGLTGDKLVHPQEVAQFSQVNGYYIPNKGTSWKLMSKGSKVYGVKAQELPLVESKIIEELQKGHPIICCMGPGEFTTTGHFVVIYDYQEGKFLIHDPNSVERSNKRWEYATIETQIRNLWAYSKVIF